MASNQQATDYGRLRNDIRKILEQEYRPGDRIPSERQLAANFRVSPATIARALNDLARTGIVSRVRGSGTYVCEPIEKVHPSMNAGLGRDGAEQSASSEPTQQMQDRIVGIIGSDVDLQTMRSDPELIPHRILSTIEREVQAAGGQTRIVELRPGTPWNEIDIIVLIENRVSYTDARSMMRVSGANDRAFNEIPVVIVRIDGRTEWPADCARIDDLWGTFDATNFLLDQGHRELAFLSAPAGAMQWADERAAAFVRAIALKNSEQTIGATGTVFHLPPNLYSAEHGLQWEQVGTAFDEIFFRQHPNVTGFVAANDSIALSFKSAIEARGLSVPSDISLVGYDNTVGAASAGLSTIDSPAEQLGAEAAWLCVQRLTNPTRNIRMEKIVRPTLLLRSSVRAI